MKYAWIERQRDAWPMEWMCEALNVSVSGYSAWKRGGSCNKRLTDTQLLTVIRSVHEETRGAYGAPHVWEELKARGIPAGKERIRKLMQAHGIRARHKRRYKATTDSKHSLPVAPNVLSRQFRTARPDQAWVADITYLPTAKGWLSLAAVMDLHTRMIARITSAI